MRRGVINTAGVELRGGSNEPEAFVGYAARYYDASDPGTEYRFGDIVERVAPGAFDQTLAEDDIRGLFDHRSEMVLGRTAAGTMTLTTDSKGLRYEIPYDATDPDHQRAASKLRRGDISGSSFGFKVRDELWSEREDGTALRVLQDVQLAEVSIVTFPAYKSSGAGLRAEDLAEVRAAYESLKRAGDASGESGGEPGDPVEERLAAMEQLLEDLSERTATEIRDLRYQLSLQRLF